jgi:hypothetical protein
MDDLPIGGSENNILKRWNLSFRIPEKESTKQYNENSQKSQQIPAYRKKEYCDQSKGDQKGEPFFGDRPTSLLFQITFSFNPLIMKFKLPPAGTINLRWLRREFTASDHGHMPCPDQFFYPEGFKQSKKGVYLLLIPRYLNGIGF